VADTLLYSMVGAATSRLLPSGTFLVGPCLLGCHMHLAHHTAVQVHLRSTGLAQCYWLLLLLAGQSLHPSSLPG
jgi:hypothetical protein